MSKKKRNDTCGGGKDIMKCPLHPSLAMRKHLKILEKILPVVWEEVIKIRCPKCGRNVYDIEPEEVNRSPRR